VFQEAGAAKGPVRLAAQVIVSEIGTDMGWFPTAGHTVSWAGLCPRNDESAGKRRSRRLRHGAPWPKTTLVQCAWAATRKKASYLQAQFQQLRHRRGPKKAVCAVAASILTAAYHMLRDGTLPHDLGPDHFQHTSPETRAKLALLANFGFSRTSRAVVLLSCGLEDTGTEEVKAGAAVHGPLGGLDAVHLSLDRACGPGQVEGGLHRIPVPAQVGGEPGKQACDEPALVLGQLALLCHQQAPDTPAGGRRG